MAACAHLWYGVCAKMIEIFGSTWWLDHLMLGLGAASFLYMLITR